MRAEGRTAAIVAAASVTAFLAGDAFGATLASLDGNAVLNLQEALLETPSYFAAHGPSMATPAILAGILAFCAVWAAWAYALTHRPGMRQGEEHGSARWGTRREGRKFMDASRFENNVIFTEHYGLAMSRPDHDRRYERNRNVLVVGGSGSGKTRGYVEPNVMQMNADFLVTDPKGETLPRIGQMLVDGGYEVACLNMVDFSQSMHYNPLAYVRDEADVLQAVNCLVENTRGEGKDADPFWEKTERLLYVALVGYLVFHCEEEDRSLSGLVTLLSLAKAKEEDESYMSPLDMIFNELETGKRLMPTGEPSEGYDPSRRTASRDAGSGWEWVKVSEPVSVDSDFCLLHYKMFKDAAGKTMKSILVSCNARMEPFAIPQVRELVSYDELHVDRLGEAGSKRAVFAVMSDTSALYSFLFAMLMWQTVNVLCDKALKRHGGSLPRPVHLVFDEFANIGKLPDIERTVAVVRSRNVSMSIILQSLSQLKARYEDDAGTIVDCCATTLFLGGKSTDTVEEISKQIGKQTLETVTVNETNGASASTTRNRSTQERDLMQASEIAQLPFDEAVVLISGAPPLRDRKYDVSMHPRWPEVHPGHDGAKHKEPFDFAEYRDAHRERKQKEEPNAL